MQLSWNVLAADTVSPHKLTRRVQLGYKRDIRRGPNVHKVCDTGTRVEVNRTEVEISCGIHVAVSIDSDRTRIDAAR